MDEIIVRYLHFISIIFTASMLIMQNFFISKTLSISLLKKLSSIDLFYGIAAIMNLVTGLLLWLVVGKPEAFYSQNPIFYTKISIFIVIGLLSILPTLFFLKHRKTTNHEIHVPQNIMLYKRYELVLLLLLPLTAVCMAKGIGLGFLN